MGDDSNEASFPSFSSFPTSFTSTYQKKPAAPQIEEAASSKRKAKDESREKRHKKKQKRDHKDRDHNSDEDRDVELNNLPPEDALPIQIDRKGDSANATYGVESRHILDFKRYGDSVLGADDIFVSHKDSRDRKTVVLISRHPRTRDSFQDRYDQFRRALRAPAKQFVPGSGTVDVHVVKPNEDFIPFEDDEVSTSHPLQLAEIREPVVASLTENAPSAPDGDAVKEDQVVRQTLEYNRRLKDNPYNVDLWLEFAKFQESTFKNKGTRRSTAFERKLSILDKALSEMPHDESLLLAYMETTVEIPWESKDILAKWDQVLQSNKLSHKLWDRYITFRMTNETAFTVPDCMEVFADCIKTLNDETELDRGATEQLLSLNLTRVCYFLAQAGYVERAIACFQAMVELSCFCPDSLRDSSFGEKLRVFEGFWESEMPRAGDEGAVGWDSTDIRAAPPTFKAEEDWAMDVVDASERSQEKKLWKPLRDVTSTLITLMLFFMVRNTYKLCLSAAADDVERVVFFNDIQPLLFDPTLPSTRSDIVYAFLNFLGIPLNNFGSNDPVMLDSLIHTECMLWPLLGDKPISSVVVGTEEEMLWKRPIAYEFPIRAFPASATTIFAMQKWFVVLRRNEVDGIERAAPGKVDFIRKLFALVMPVFSGDAILQSSYLLFESFNNPQSAYKLAKQLLKNDRMNLALWNAYAQTELLRDKIEEARRVYMNAIPLSLSTEALKEESAFLYRMLAELELKVNPARAVAVVLSCAEQQSTVKYDEFDQNTYPPTRIVKAQNILSQQITSGLSTSDPGKLLHPTKSPLHSIYLKALLESITKNIEVACSTYEDALKNLQNRDMSGGILEEMMYEDYTHVIHRHMLDGSVGFRPSILRNVVERALGLFPHNIIFHSLYVLNESRTQIEGRVKKQLHEFENRNPSHVIWSFHLWTEMQLRPQRNLHYIRAIFENAVACPTSRHSVAIWFNYFLFELSQKNYEKAKRIIMQAVVACPWSKEMALLAVEKLGGILSNDEIQALLEIMKRRDIRIRQTLDEYNVDI
ncbi:hypothetical protein SmJEL517_g01547 [Synchytrium microbalum]|uniref:DUF1740-domain-containing protein n=1 Tax=Synchytrium microbalum TaxID=1806994 RepID=A0A507C3W6_9FUNG|nr:uncharacterized protein SmJEL517_g01547 [Synchytrium microbalum]TPX36230.1 hypothetical protein SmJEL517_g01547 [Synchytrium microbalum]